MTIPMRRAFVSFPKSGRTWLRYAFRLAGVDEQIDFHHDGFEYSDGSRPTLDFDFDARLARGLEVDRLIYLDRDPRDVMVSLYHQVTGRFRTTFNYAGSISDFIRDPYFGAGNLAEFRRQWDEVCARRPVFRTSYEDCHRDLGAVLKSAMDYLGFACPEARLVDIAEASSFSQMRQVEQSGAFDQPWLRPRDGAPKVRGGQAGAHRLDLSQSDIAFLNQVFQLEP
jgi:hypothetical protein